MIPRFLIVELHKRGLLTCTQNSAHLKGLRHKSNQYHLRRAPRPQTCTATSPGCAGKSAKVAATREEVCSLVHSWRDCSVGLLRLVSLCCFTWKSLYKAPLGCTRRLCFARVRFLYQFVLCNIFFFFSSFVRFVLFIMAAYTLPEGFTDFDMFTFGTALLVGGKWAEWGRQKGPCQI